DRTAHAKPGAASAGCPGAWLYCRAVRILLVEDDPETRRGLAGALSAVGTEVVPCGSVTVAFDALDRSSFDLVVVDLGLPDGTGAQVIRRARASTPSAVVLVVTVFDDDESITAALRAGAHGYLLKDASPAELVEQVRAAVDGGGVLSPAVSRRVVAMFSGPVACSAIRMGRRELELLELLQAGTTYEEAARRMDLQVGTV